MKKLQIFAVALCLVCAASLSFYSLNAQEPPVNSEDEEYDGGELSGATVTCDTGGSGRCYKTKCESNWVPFSIFPMRLTKCYGTAPQTVTCISGIPC